MKLHYAALALVLAAAPIVAVAESPAAPPACAGSTDTTYRLSACSGAPGAKLTLISLSSETPSRGESVVAFKSHSNVVTGIRFTQGSPRPGDPSQVGNFTVAPDDNSGTPVIVVPQVCNGGNPTFSLTINVEHSGSTVSHSFGTFAATCPTSTAPPTVSILPLTARVTGGSADGANLSVPVAITSCPVTIAFSEQVSVATNRPITLQAHWADSLDRQQTKSYSAASGATSVSLTPYSWVYVTPPVLTAAFWVGVSVTDESGLANYSPAFPNNSSTFSFELVCPTTVNGKLTPGTLRRANS